MSDIVPAFPSHWIANWNDLPVLKIPPAKLTDEDIEFNNDMAYLRALLNAIVLGRMS